MNYVRAFLAGMAFPAAILPVVYSILYLSGHQEVRTLPLQFMPLLLPLVFGAWNILYFVVAERFPVRNSIRCLWAAGALLGFLVALVGVFVIGLPGILLGLTGPMQYLPLVVIPVFYGLIWRFVVGSLDRLVGLEA